MKSRGEMVEIPVSVLDSVDTLDELEDRLMAHNSRLIEELCQARRDDLRGEFKVWKPSLKLTIS